MYWVVWSFQVKRAHVSAFERVYGPGGDWAKLFQRAPGFAGTELRHEPDLPAHYLTIDRWRTRDDYHRFKDTFRTEYEALDARCAALTETERKLGDFETTAQE